MSETSRIADQINRSLVGEAWHGPAVFELLEGITAQQAVARPLKNSHTIWELTGHLAVWAEETRDRYHGGGRARLTPEENFPLPPVPANETAWEAAKKRLLAAHEAWCAELDKIDPSLLYPPQREKFPSLYVILHGLVQHNLYHAGQIALIKKVL
jgi:uncharacterized damage-inducible protein DinB